MKFKSNIYTYLLFLSVILFASSCSKDDDKDPDVDFSGTFAQEDQMGRPGINTVFTATEALENSFNRTIPSNMVSAFQPAFQSRIEAYYAAYSATAGATIRYENNILGLDLPTLTTALALDVLQVAPDAPSTTYFASTSNFLTGRNLNDDVIDVSLILLFGGRTGARFASMPNLVSDNVGVEAGAVQATFPYLTAPQF
jgi:hypothetical protein